MSFAGTAQHRIAFFLAALVHCLIIFNPSFLSAEEPAAHKIGVMASRGKNQCLKQWQHTALYLTDKLPGASFTIVPLDFEEIDAAVKDRRIDFIITDPAMYVDLEIRYRAQRIATLENLLFDKSVTVYGGVIFTRSDRKDITRLEDLKHKRFMAANKDSFGGWLAGWRELKEHGINPERDFKELKFAGTQDAVVRAVKSGEVDAGTVRTDMLERMALEGKIDFKEFRVLNEDDAEQQKADVPFSYSTDLYPEWPFAKLQHTPADLAEKVCIALFSIQPDDLAAVTGTYSGWTVSLSYQMVHECLKELRYGPYKDFGKIPFKDVLKKYWLLILGILIVLIIQAFIINYILRLNRKLRQSQLAITNEHEKLRESEQKFRSIIEESVEGIILSDEQGSIIEWNRSLEQISGLKPDEVMGRPIWDVQFQMALEENKTSAAYERLKTMLTGLLNTGRASLAYKPVDWNIQHPDGMQRIIQSLTFPIKTSRGFMVAGFVLDITARKQAEQKLLETKNYLDNIINSSLDAILAGDMTACITQCNQAFLDLTGYTEDEVIGKSAHELIPIVGETYESTTGEMLQITEDFYNATIKQISQLRETGKTTNWETYYLSRDKKVIPVEQSIFSLTDKRGNRIGSASIIRDITERKKTEKKLMETKNYLENIIENSQDAIVMNDATGCIARCNKYFYNMLGYGKDEVIGRYQYEFAPMAEGTYESSTGKTIDINSAFAEEAQQAMATLLETGRVSNWQTYLMHKNKKLLPAEVNIVMLYDDKGNKIGYVGINRDITERKKAEQQLIETKDYLENIIKNSWDAIVIGDNTGRLTKCNRYFLNLIGYTEDEVIGRNMYEFAPTSDGLYESLDGGTVTIDEAFFKQGRDSIATLFENGNIANWQTYLISKSKKLIPVEENIVLLFDNAGNRIGSVGTLRDITERRRIENERERLIAELQEALVQVKTLSGFIPICSSCKKVRNDSGYWEQVEAYISTRSEAEFTHSICPDCAKKLYPEIYKELHPELYKDRGVGK